MQPANLSEAATLLNNILASAATITTLSSHGSQQQPPSTSAVDSRLASLFPSRSRNVSLPLPTTASISGAQAPPPRYQAQQCFGVWKSGTRKKRDRVQQYEHFNKDVVLLPDPSWTVVCKQGPKLWLHNQGHILSAFEFKKVWDHQTIINRIREGFGDRIPADVSLQLLMPCGNKLVLPKLQGGQELTGMLIHKVYRTKSLYIRPSRELLTISEDDVEHSPISTQPTFSMCTRAAARLNRHDAGNETPILINPSSSDEEEGHGTIHAASNTVKGHRGMEGNGSIFGTSTFEVDRSVRRDDIPSTSSASMEVDVPVRRGGIPSTSSAGVDEDYATYLDLVADLSGDFSEDEELQQAIIASMENQITEKVPVEEILQELSSKISTKETCRFNINRSSVWDGAVRGFQRASYDPNFRMSVKFSDDMGKNEESVDLGGPRREFLRLLIEAIAMSPMFEGKENRKTLAINSTALREDWYYTAGRAISVSLVHGGPPPNFLSPLVFSLLTDSSPKPEMEDIADSELLEKVQRVSESTTLEELESSKAPLLDFLANAGCLRPMRSVRDKDLLVHDIVMFQVIHRVQGPFQRFREGLKTLGVLNLLQQYPDSFRPLFSFQPSPMTWEFMEDLFEIRRSTEGSNKWTAEDPVVSFWRDYLLDSYQEDGPKKLQKILAFATGATMVPPVGFSPCPSVEFIHNGADCTSTPMFPTANTCINTIRLPLHDSYKQFKEKFDFALANTYGFGQP
ncbi:uncharacterized protein LOC143123864 isoform X2 [Alosa pseudoharengus]|uniref:uncharacterized protein LOC143123864 isoform X2 n=1 Tax=Alosa pseudoharengus TaxID=34774 RepID=UPI003F8985F5